MFAGIVIYMYAKEHGRPHFHARFGDYKASFSFDGVVIEGQLPSKKEKLVKIWAKRRQAELRENWELRQNGELPKPINPLGTEDNE
jgi:hypothetical protein